MTSSNLTDLPSVVKISLQAGPFSRSLPDLIVRYLGKHSLPPTLTKRSVIHYNYMNIAVPQLDKTINEKANIPTGKDG